MPDLTVLRGKTEVKRKHDIFTYLHRFSPFHTSDEYNLGYKPGSVYNLKYSMDTKTCIQYIRIDDAKPWSKADLLIVVAVGWLPLDIGFCSQNDTEIGVLLHPFGLQTVKRFRHHILYILLTYFT